MRKALLLMSAIALAMSSQAETKFFFKHNNAMIPNFADGKDLRSGNALYYTPSGNGSMAEYDQPFLAEANGDGAAVGDYGFQFETRSWIAGTTPEEECVKPNEIIMAFDYKVNMPSSTEMMYTIFNGGVFNGGGCTTSGNVLTVSDEWQTCYLLANDRPSTWAVYGEMQGENWMWVRFTDVNHIKNPDFRMMVKCPRLLTADEAKADVEANFDAKKDIPTTFFPMNDGFGADTTDDGELMYEIKQSQDGSFNPIMATGGLLYSLPATHDTFAFDYQTTQSFKINIFAWCPEMVSMATGLLIDEQYQFGEEEFGTFSYNAKDFIAQRNFGQAFASNHYLWIQVPAAEKEAAESALIIFKNPRWTSEANLSGIEDIAVDETDAPAIYYNLQGMRVAEPSNGLYIKHQGNKTTKVLVK